MKTKIWQKAGEALYVEITLWTCSFLLPLQVIAEYRDIDRFIFAVRRQYSEMRRNCCDYLALQASVSVKRLKNFLSNEELDESSVSHDPAAGRNDNQYSTH